MSEIINELLEKLKQCDDFHNRCDFLMEHSEITYMLDYIEQLQQENKKYKEVINKAIEYLKIYRSYQKNDNKDYLKGRDEIGCLDICQVDELLEILKEVK